TVPRFRMSPDSQPTSCGNEGPGSVSAAASASSIVYFDPNFRFPQNLKVSLGADRVLPWDMVGTFDFLFTKSINQFYISDVNLQGVVGDWSGEGGRPLYGTIAAGTGTAGSASATPTRPTGSFRDVLRHENRSADRSFSVTGQLQKRFSDGVEFDVGYTYSHTEDLFSLTSSIASSNYRFTTLDGTIANRNLRTSAFDIPHKITASGTFDVKWGVQLSVIYVGQSGSPYSYVVSNDINGDAFGGNDPVYVPRNRADMSMDGNGSGNSQGGFGTAAPQDSAYAVLDNYINSEGCLNNHTDAAPTTKFGTHAAKLGGSTPPAPTALESWNIRRSTNVVARHTATPHAAPLFGVEIARGAPNKAMMMQANGTDSFRARS